MPVLVPFGDTIVRSNPCLIKRDGFYIDGSLQHTGLEHCDLGWFRMNARFPDVEAED